MERLEQTARQNGLGILEDACEAFGAVDSGGTKVGSRGSLATFGFYPNKQIATGEGGMLCGNPGALAQARSERNQGRGQDMDWLAHDRLGFNYRLSDVAAAIGVAQIERARELLDARARVAAMYTDRLAGIEGLDLPCPDRGGERRSWFVFVVQVPPKADRDGVIAALAERGVASKGYMPCIHLQPFYRERFNFKGGEFPVAEQVAARSLALPFFGAMSEAQVDRVCTALREVLGQ
jgi:perosamine synthetase